MRLRLVSIDKNLLLYCEDGSTKTVDESLLKKLFISYQSIELFHDGEEKWNQKYTSIDQAPGKTLAYVNKKNELCIVDANPFYKLITSVGNSEYITAQEYADLHNKGVARVKVLCSKNKLAGVVRKGGCWFIPIDAPYPKDQRTKKGS